MKNQNLKGNLFTRQTLTPSEASISKTIEGFLNVRKTILTLPYPPSANNLFATYRGRRILSVRGIAYKKEVLAICFTNRVKPFLGDVAIEINAYRPRKVGDLDNLQKIIFDSLKGSAFIDDKQIVKIIAQRFDNKNNPRVEIQISEIFQKLESEFVRG